MFLLVMVGMVMVGIQINITFFAHFIIFATEHRSSAI